MAALRYSLTRLGSRFAAAFFVLVCSTVAATAEVCDKIDELWIPGDSPFRVLLRSQFLFSLGVVLVILFVFDRFKFHRSSKALAVVVGFFAMLPLLLDDSKIRHFAYIEGCRSLASDTTIVLIWFAISFTFYWFSLRGQKQET